MNVEISCVIFMAISQPLKRPHFNFCLSSALLVPFWKQLKNRDKTQNDITGRSTKPALGHEQEPVVSWLTSGHRPYPCREKPTRNSLILYLQFLDWFLIFFSVKILLNKPHIFQYRQMIFVLLLCVGQENIHVYVQLKSPYNGSLTQESVAH